MKITVAINVFQESLVQVRECFWRLRNLPEARVHVIFNGVERSEIADLALDLGFYVQTGRNYGSNATWNLFWMRMLNFAVSHEFDVFFKMDPDTMVDRTPKAILSADYFGSIEMGYHGIPIIQGGCTGLGQKAARSPLQELQKGPQEWFFQSSSFDPFMDDQYVGKMLYDLGIFPVAWPECHSVWDRQVANDDFKYAIVHPRNY